MPVTDAAVGTSTLMVSSDAELLGAVVSAVLLVVFPSEDASVDGCVCVSCTDSAAAEDSAAASLDATDSAT